MPQIAETFNPACREIWTYIAVSLRVGYSIGVSRLIDQRGVVQALAALAQDTRMTAFQRLAAAYPASIGAGDVARGCKVPQNTMSTHLSVLTRAGLLKVERAGRQMNYRADLDGIRAVIMYLAEECCDGRNDLSALRVGHLFSNHPVPKAGRKISSRAGEAKPSEKPRR